MFPAIEDLAADVNVAWSRSGYAEAAFCEIAAELLNRPLELDFANLARSVCEGEPLPEQRRMDQGFGQPAITLKTDERFTIEVLCWHSSTPAIHQHAFSGAFRVLTGSSVHSKYAYTEYRRFGGISVGDLVLKEVAVLDRTSTIAIPRGRDLIHANFHLDSPTMTIVVRTYQRSEPELTYLPPGIAYDSMSRSPALHKRIELLDTMHQTGHEAYLDCLRAAITHSDVYDGMSIVMRAGARVSASVFSELTGLLRWLHGEKIGPLISALNEERRRGAIVRLRSTVIDPDSRFFLAGLLSVTRRKDLTDIMAMRHGDVRTARSRIASGVAILLGGNKDRQLVSAAVTRAILDGVSAEPFPEWASRLWQRSVSDNEKTVLESYYQYVLEHPLLTPLIT